ANAGGVATSALEMQQNPSRDTWTLQYTEKRLHQIIYNIHRERHEIGAEHGAPSDSLVGAKIVGFRRVADAVSASGVVSENFEIINFADPAALNFPQQRAVKLFKR